jgi:amino acid transporter
LAPVPEKALLHAQLLAYAFLAAAGQFAGVGSSAVFFLSAASTFVALLIDRVTSCLSASTVDDAGMAEKMRDGDAKGAGDRRNKVDKAEAKDGFVSLWTYALGQTVPLLTGTQLTSATLVVFVPLVRYSYFFHGQPSSYRSHRLGVLALRLQQNTSLLPLWRSWVLTRLISLRHSLIDLICLLSVKQS